MDRLEAQAGLPGVAMLQEPGPPLTRDAPSLFEAFRAARTEARSEQARTARPCLPVPP